VEDITDMWGRLTPTQRDVVTALIRELTAVAEEEHTSELITVRDASAEFGVSRTYLYDMMSRGLLDYVVPYGRERGKLIRRQDLLSLLS